MMQWRMLKPTYPQHHYSIYHFDCSLLPDVQADYFDRNTVVIVDYSAIAARAENDRNLIELADKIQGSIRNVSNDPMFIGAILKQTSGSSIPKTTKPVEIFSLRYPPNPGWHPSTRKWAIRPNALISCQDGNKACGLQAVTPRPST